MRIKEILYEEHGGFSGITHWLIAIFLFMLMWLAPWPLAENFIAAITKDNLFAIMIFFIVGGAALLPDLDSSPLQEGGSTAVHQLGILGYSLSIIAITLSQVTYSIFHTRYDEKPKSQHRMLWHTPLIPLLILAYVLYVMPHDGSKLWNYRNNPDYYGMFVLVFFAATSAYLGLSMLAYKLLRLFGKQKHTQFICLTFMALSIVYMLNCDYKNLILIGEAVALGYFFHEFGDIFTQGSVPAFFPIPTIKNKRWVLWSKPYILGYTFAIATGGAINTILNFVLMASNIYLGWFLFIK